MTIQSNGQKLKDQFVLMLDEVILSYGQQIEHDPSVKRNSKEFFKVVGNREVLRELRKALTNE